jgi:hypothetical protein
MPPKKKAAAADAAPAPAAAEASAEVCVVRSHVAPTAWPCAHLQLSPAAAEPSHSSTQLPDTSLVQWQVSCNTLAQLVLCTLAPTRRRGTMPSLTLP